MKELLLSATIIFLLVLWPAPSLQAQGAVVDMPRPAALAGQEKSTHTEADTGGEESSTDEPDNTDPAETLKEIRENLRLLRGRQAEMGADMTNLADEVRKLRGELEEMRHPDQIKSARKDSQARPEDSATPTKKVENLTGTGQSQVKEGKRDATQAGAPDAAQEGKSGLKELYLSAFKDYKSRRYDGARRKFQAFLKQFPQASLASGAQFWIGECYYMEGNFEKAILEYDKVLLNYPKGEMVPHSLLKQGLSFLKIGDKTGAKILLEKLSGDYPNTDQANIAKSTLATLK